MFIGPFRKARAAHAIAKGLAGPGASGDAVDEALHAVADPNDLEARLHAEIVPRASSGMDLDDRS